MRFSLDPSSVELPSARNARKCLQFNISRNDMRCIFCKTDSSTSRSVEHIIPESLWNTKQILPPGVVCDKCNNYFARDIEKPFLESPSIRSLRFHQALPNKRGRVPEIDGIILPSHAVRLQRYAKGPIAASIAVPTDAFEAIMQGRASTVVIPVTTDAPSERVVSRFLAKIAIEALAQRVADHPGGIDYVVDENQFDPLRSFARLGQPREWPHHARRIYDADRPWNDGSELDQQCVHEYDFLYTELGELYFVLALYGLELTINIGGPEIDGYRNWLKKNEDASPLYSGKNSHTI